MTEQHGARKRRARLALVLTAGVALVGTLIGYSQPDASATSNTQTKYYDVSLSGSPVGTNIPSTITVQLTNDGSSTQSFGSAELNFGSLPASAVTGVTATPSSGAPAWSAAPTASKSLVWLFTSQNSVAIAPNSWLTITFTLDAPSAGSLPLATTVKQSNNFSGNGNNFINLTGDPSITVYQSCSTNCTLTATSALTGTSGSADVNGPSTPFLASAAFGVSGDLSCDGEVTTTAGDPFVVATPGTPTAYGTVSMTFPKSVVNSLANNGTPLMQVCARASLPFTAVDLAGNPTPATQVGTSEYDGLLPDCPSYISGNPPTDPSTLTGSESIPSGTVLMCVLSRAKHAANETIVIYVSDFSDPSFW